MDILEKVKSVIASQLRIEVSDIADDASIIEDLGADSLDIVDIIMAFEAEFGSAIPEEDIASLRTVSDMADYIAERI